MEQSPAEKAATAAAAAARLAAARPAHADQQSQGPSHNHPTVVEAKKALLKTLNWKINDDKHRKLEQILDTAQYLQRICNNVRDNPGEPKYRRIRVSNPVFGRHVRDVLGGEEFLRVAGWGIKVESHEKYFVFEHQPGTIEWAVLEEACMELGKLVQLVDGKIQRGQADRKAEQQRRLSSVRAALEEDKEDRTVRFQRQLEAQAHPEAAAGPGSNLGSPRSPQQHAGVGGQQPQSPRHAAHAQLAGSPPASSPRKGADD